MGKFRAGIVGSKFAADFHCDAYSRNRNVEVVSVAAIDNLDVISKKWNIPRTYEDLPRRHPLPDRHPDGRYSIGGTARRFDVSTTVVRRWVKRGMVNAACEDFDAHRQVYWLEIDEETAARLEAEAKRTRSRMKPRK